MVLQSKKPNENDEDDDEDENLETLKRIQLSNPSPTKTLPNRKITIVNEEYQNELKEAAKLIENTDQSKERSDSKISSSSAASSSSTHQATSIIANFLLTARERVNSIGKENLSNNPEESVAVVSTTNTQND